MVDEEHFLLHGGKANGNQLLFFKALVAKTHQVINKISSKRGQDHTTSQSLLLRQSVVLSLV